MSIGLHTHMPDGEDEFARRLRKLQQDFDEFKAARTLENAEIDAAAGKGIRTSDFDGTSFADSGTAGNYFGGDGAVFNHVKFRPGSIDDVALANPSDFDTATDGTVGFSISTSVVAKASAVVTVPDGFTRALINMGTNCSVQNTAASGTFIYLDSWIGSSYSGGSVFNYVTAGGWTTMSGGAVAELTGLAAGQQILCQARLSADTAMAAASANIANVNATAIFLR